MSPGGEGVLAGEQRCAVECRSSVTLSHPPALLLPARAQGWRGGRWLTHKPGCDRAGGEQAEKMAEWVFAHTGFGVVFVYRS